MIEYEWNNLYQESLLNLLKSLLNYADEHQDLQKYLIENIKIFDLIQKYTTLDTLEKFKFTNTKENDLKEEERITLPINHGYYSFFISLSYKLNTVLGGTPVNIDGGIPRQGSFFFMKRVPEEGDKKAALDMLYGGLGDDKEEKKEEEEPDNFCFECMKEFMNDQWREFFGMNIESIIKQYEDKNWPKQEKKPFDSALDNPGEGNEDLLNSGDNYRDKNIFGDNNDGDMLGNFEDDANPLFMIRISQGLLYMGKGLLTLDPLYSHKLLINKKSIAGILITLFSFTETEALICDKHQFLLYSLALAMKPKFVMTVDENLKPKDVQLMVGQAVDIVGQTGNPRTISGFQIHTSPAIINSGERCEINGEDFVPYSDVMEGVVIVKEKERKKEE